MIGANGKPVKPKKRVKKEPVVCSYCGKEFSDKSCLWSHERFVHEKRFSVSCHVCGLKIISRQMLNMHLLGVHPEDPVSKQLEEKEGLKLRKCEVVGCSAKFLRKELLDRHVEKMHKGGGGLGNEARFKCKFCGKRILGEGEIKVS